MPDDLNVLAEDLNQRGGTQRAAAGDFSAAEAATDGATMSVFVTHGLACSVATTALYAAQDSRTAATQAMNRVSNELAEALDIGAADYRRTDHSEEGNLSGQMHPR